MSHNVGVQVQLESDTKLFIRSARPRHENSELDHDFYFQNE